MNGRKPLDRWLVSQWLSSSMPFVSVSLKRWFRLFSSFLVRLHILCSRFSIRSGCPRHMLVQRDISSLKTEDLRLHICVFSQPIPFPFILSSLGRTYSFLRIKFCILCFGPLAWFDEDPFENETVNVHTKKLAQIGTSTLTTATFSNAR